MSYWIPWTNNDLKMDYCKQVAQELRDSGEYEAVRIDSKQPERGIAFGKVFVKVKEE